MSEFKITVPGGSTVRLPTSGKYCDRDIVITATGNSGAAGVETCSVTVDFFSYGAIMYTQLTSGGISAQQISGAGQVVLTDVVCGSMIAVYLPSSNVLIECYDVELLSDYGNFKTFTAPDSPGNGYIWIDAG